MYVYCNYLFTWKTSGRYITRQSKSAVRLIGIRRCHGGVVIVVVDEAMTEGYTAMQCNNDRLLVGSRIIIVVR